MVRALLAAVLLPALALALRWSTLPEAGPVYPAAPFFPAVTIVAVYAGWRWGLASLAVSMAMIWILLRGPEGLGDDRPAGAILFAGSSIVCVLVAATLRRVVLKMRRLSGERMLTEQSLAQAQERLKLAQDVGGVGLWDWDLTTGQGYWSETVYRNLGLDPGQPPSMEAMFAAIHPEDRDRVRAASRIARDHGRMEPTEYRLATPDGGVRWLLSRGEVLRDETGRIVRAVGVNIDVTERRLAEEAVRESEARFHALADSAPALMWVSRLGGRREFVNRTYVEFAGGTYQEVLDLDWRDRLEAHDLPRILKEQIAGETSMQPFTLEARYQRADGEWRWLKSYSQPRHGPAGEFLGFIGIAFDVTEAKQVEHDLTRINDLLAERIEATLSERDQVQAALIQAQKLEALGQLTGGVAHDFNNLLTVIIGALDILQRHPEDTARVAKLSAAALGAAHRGERLTQQLLAFSRRQPLRPEVVCVDALLRESEPLYRRAVGEGTGFELQLGAGEARARLDAAQLEAALLNLLVNARDAMDGAGRVRLETAAVSRDEARGDIGPGDYVCVSVCDEGSGMDAETLAKAFEPFFTTKAVGKGTGLGLSQVYGFARQTGGGLEIESEPGKGTTVRLLLPASRDEVRAVMSPVARARRRPLTVLLVEDDVVVGDTVEAMLNELGHTVLRADNADAALEIAGREPRIGLVLTDVIMPGGKTGVDLGAALTGLRPGLPIVLSSGYTGEALAQAEAAPWPLLRKPYSIEGLATALAHAVDHPARGFEPQG